MASGGHIKVGVLAVGETIVTGFDSEAARGSGGRKAGGAQAAVNDAGVGECVLVGGA